MDKGEKESTLPVVGGSDLDVPLDTEIRKKQDPLLLSDLPKLIAEGGNLMAKQFVTAVILGTVLAVCVPAVQAEIEKEVVVSPDQPELSRWEKAKATGLSLYDSARDKVRKLTSDDARLAEALERNDALIEENASLRKQLNRNDIEVGINHRVMMECAKDVYNYLESQLPQPTEVK